MRVIQMNPHEPLARSVFVPPAHGGLEDRARAALLLDEVDGCLTLPVVVVVLVETLIEAETGVERKCADESARRVTSGAEESRDRRMFRVQCKSCILTHAVLIGIQPRQDVHVRRKREDVVRVGIRKNDSAAGQGIEKRRVHARIAGIAESVRARRVDRDQDDVARGTERRGHLPTNENNGGDTDRDDRRDGEKCRALARSALGWLRNVSHVRKDVRRRSGR